MLTQETTIGIYPNGNLTDILIVPDGHEYHLFFSGGHEGHNLTNNAGNAGSIVFVNNDWLYEGSGLQRAAQIEVAAFIATYYDAPAGSGTANF